jgi:response regulator RpfG family c-di-GMP phosphodiesterase/serine/threonine protein kinase
MTVKSSLCEHSHEHQQGAALPREAASSSAGQLLQELLSACLVRPRDWDSLADSARAELTQETNQTSLLARLVDHKLLTEYQADRVKAGGTFGLVLGNYRVLDELGAGGMGVVYRGEHLRLPRLVAIKVLTVHAGYDPQSLSRFSAEMWAVAQMQHPHIVTAVDAGEVIDSARLGKRLCYYVMEYVSGQDLAALVYAHGPLLPAKACELIHQIAGALVEAHEHHLVHRDIKPSNVMVTPGGQAKLLDFGLARHLGNRMTEPGTVMGTLDYVAPEQALDASTVDVRADIYALGGTLFWCLTGRPPFPAQGGGGIHELAGRLVRPPPSARAWNTEVPPELDAVVKQMMAVDPDDRYATPEAVMRALLPFLEQHVHPRAGDRGRDLKWALIPDVTEVASRLHQVLIVDDEPNIRTLCRFALQAEGGLVSDEAADGSQALEAVHARPYDLILLDVDLPGIGGLEVLQRLRAQSPVPHLKIIMFSGRASSDEMAQTLLVGADDSLTKPVSIVQLRARVRAALRLKDAQDRSDLLNRNLLTLNHELEQNLSARDSDLVHARNALVLALAELATRRDGETGAHLMRLQRFGRCLAEAAATIAPFAGQIDPHFIRMLEICAPLHDIGKVALPDHILLKPGKLDADERLLMQTHTVAGAETLERVAQRHGSAVAFLRMAIDIARHHHERYDGTGYPDHLAGEDIPLAARIVSIADVYDALRCRRSYKPALSHAAAVELITEKSPGQFDPLLLQAFQRCASAFEQIAREFTD